jgi:enoyl-CoA hydratase/carnithine racemase
VAQTVLETAVRDLVAQIASTAPKTFAAAKLSSRAGNDPQLRAAAQAAIDACFDSDDFSEGRAAFHARRVPAFKGK